MQHRPSVGLPRRGIRVHLRPHLLHSLDDFTRILLFLQESADQIRDSPGEEWSRA